MRQFCWPILAMSFITLMTSAVLAQEPTDAETTDIDTAIEQSLSGAAKNQKEEKELRPLPDIKDVSELGRLSHFEDIAVMQRRYLPKTGRLELFPNLGFIINDAFFTNAIFSARASYYFTEAYGVELNGMYLSTTDRNVTKELKSNWNIETRALVTPQSYLGLDFKWSPVYGKMGYFDKSIIPFDMYFALGGGNTRTNQGSDSSTLHIGMGQIFAITKWAAFRWDVSSYWYQAQANNGATGTFNNIYAMVGVSFFVPEAKYR